MEVLHSNDFSSSALDDAVIVKRVMAGEKELFEIILRRYNQTLYRVIRGYLKDGEELEDAMQNTYLKAYDRLAQFRGDAAFSTWLIRIGINEALLQLRDMRKERKLYDTDADTGAETVKQIPDRQPGPEMQIIGREGERLLELAVEGLPDKYRVVYILKEVEGMANRQIAQCLDISDDNVKVRLHRAHRLLKDTLFQLTGKSSILEFGNRRCDAVVDAVMRNIR